MNHLKRYYYHVGIPIALIAIGTAVFFKEIMGTVKGNPHPQINYLIFVLIVAGCIQMMLHIRRINREGALIQSFFDAFGDQKKTGQLLKHAKSRADTAVVAVLDFVQPLQGRPPTDLQHTAIESEMERFQASQSRELLVAQFLAGMMVGLGLIGTFIGLLGALNEIGKLIGSFSMGAAQTDPMAAINELVTRLTAPMQAMGVAFSASLFGVMGSLIMGILMVSVRRATSDLVSALKGRMSLALDVSNLQVKGDGDEAIQTTELATALGALAEQAPLLQGLMVALDQSERRVRELLSGMSLLTGEILASHQDRAAVADAIHAGQLQHQSTLTTLNHIVQGVSALSQESRSNTEVQTRMGQSLIDQRDMMVGFVGSIQQHQQIISTEVKSLVERQGDAWEKSAAHTVALQSEQFAQFQKLQKDQLALWQQQATMQHDEATAAAARWSSKIDTERDLWLSQIASMGAASDHLQTATELQVRRVSEAVVAQASSAERLNAFWVAQQQASASTAASLAGIVSDLGAAAKTDSLSRAAWIAQLRASLEEWSARNEQTLQAVLSARQTP